MKDVFTTRLSFSKFLAALLGITLAFLLGEIVVRVTGIGDVYPYVVVNETLLKRRPLSDFVNRKENTNLAEINNFGFHDYDRDSHNEKYRFLVLGDSFVEGVQVPLENLFTSLLEKQFQNVGCQVEIINGGFGGIATAYQYHLWHHFFKENRIKVDHIVLTIYMGNDLENNHILLNRELGNQPFYLQPFLDAGGNVFVHSQAVTLSWRQKVFRFLSEHSAFINTAYTNLYLLKKSYLSKRASVGSELAQSNVPADQSQSSSSLDSAWNESVEGSLRLIERWNEELSGEDIPFSIAVIHSPDYYVDGGYSNEYKVSFLANLDELAERDGFPVLKLNFDDSNPYDLYSFDGTTLGHFNEMGHRSTANRMFSWLRSSACVEQNLALR